MENSQYMQWDYHSYGDGPPKRDNSESVMIFDAPIDFASYGESFKLRLSLRRRPGSDRVGLLYVKFYQGGTANDPSFLSGEAWIVKSDSNWYPSGYAPIGNTVEGGQPWSTDVDLLTDGEWSTVEILPENIISLDDKVWAVKFVMDDGPVRYYLYERPRKKVSFMFTSRKALEELTLSKMHPVVIKARDGLKLISYLTLPYWTDEDQNGRPAKPLPMVLFVHGGPWGRVDSTTRQTVL